MSYPLHIFSKDNTLLSEEQQPSGIPAFWLPIKPFGLFFCVFKFTDIKVNTTLDTFLLFKIANFLVDVYFFSYSDMIIKSVL